MAEYPIPPWLSQQPDWAGIATRTSIAKANIAQQQQQMAQQATEFQSRMEMQQMSLAAEQKAQEQQLKQQSEIAQHRLAVESAYNQAKMQLEGQQLQEASRKVDLDYIKAAKEFSENQQFEQMVEEKGTATGDWEGAFKEAVIRRGSHMPAAVFSAIGSMQRANELKQDVVPKPHTIRMPSGRDREVLSGGGRWQDVTQPEESAIGTEMIAPDRAVVTLKNGKQQIITIPKFKFSKQKELDLIETQYRAYIDDESKLKNLKSGYMKDAAESAVKRYKELMKLMEQEQEKYGGGVRNSERGTSQIRRLTFDPGKGRYLTNSP